MQHGLEQMLRALAAGGLCGSQFADFADTLGEFLLQWEWQHENGCALYR